MLKDDRIVKLANNLLTHSTRIQKGERVLIRGHHVTKPLLMELTKQAIALGAQPHVEVMDDDLSAAASMGRTENEYKTMLTWMLNKIENFDAVISAYGTDNDYASKNVPAEIKLLGAKTLRPYSNKIVNEKRWVLLNYPTQSLAQKAKMSLEEFTDYVLNVSTVDYKKMDDAMTPLIDLMNKTDKVRIVAPDTDLTFSIKDIPAVKCAGEYNIPDGEVFTAPVKDSVNGTIHYNTPSPYRGVVYNNVKLTFKDGKIVEATADNDVDKLNEIFDTDEGARFVGEFAIGVNPLIEHPMGDILYDEKIAGSFHFTPGQAYENDADNGNRSAVHWDLVLIQRDEYGGGQIYFDDILIRDNGIFVIDELKGLNPDNLK